MTTDIQIAGIYVWQGKAFVPTYGRVVGGGPFVELEPVFVSELARDKLVSAIRSASAAGHPPMPNLSSEARDQQTSPILAATGARSWSDLQRRAITYTIEWGPGGVFLEFSRSAPEGGWEFDSEKRRHFKSDVELEVIADAILEDLAARRTPKKRSSSNPL